MIFTEDCSRCHTLVGREEGAVGGDLARTRLDVATLASFAKVMPARAPLTADDARAVAEYVHRVATSRSGG
jgi:mono/diheme cytochrome c family protein